jgi:hypothetical protein
MEFVKVTLVGMLMENNLGLLLVIMLLTPPPSPPIHDGSSGMLDMLHEVFPIVTDPNVSQSPISEMGGEAKGVHEDLQSTNQGTEKFYEFLNDAKKPLNDLGQPIGDQSGKFSNFAGTLVRDKNIMPIDYTNWKKVPNRHKEDAWNLIQV